MKLRQFAADASPGVGHLPPGQGREAKRFSMHAFPE
jgi:hypothetical protein